jgi:hypothetical protein
VREPAYTLALPGGWRRTEPPAGADFAATSADGTAEATLWVERDRRLGFDAFEARSIDQLRELAGNAEVSERVPGPTPEQTVVRLSADASPESGGATYEVTLRSAGPYRYFLSTMVAADASAVARQESELIQSSFFPERE